MALNGSLLGQQIKAAVDALTDEQKQDRDELFEAMGTAIVTHITNNAQVSVLVTSVTSGGSTAPGTGTIA